MTTTTRGRFGSSTVLVATALAAVFMSAQDGARKVTGVVLDAAGNDPISGASVEYEDHSNLSLGVQTTTTDEKGRFEIAQGIRGVATIAARGYGTARRAWPPARDLELRVAMVPPVVVRGTMLDLVTGQGVDGDVTLIVHNINNPLSDSVEAQGTFRIVDTPPGPAMVLARADGFAPYLNTFNIDAGKEYDLRVGLLLAAAGSGVVHSADGRPVGNAEVRVSYSSSLMGAELFAGLAAGQNSVSDSEGEFRVDGLVPDTPVRLQAFLGDQRSNIVAIEVAPGRTQTDIVLQLSSS